MYRPEDFNASAIRKRVQVLAANQWSADYEVALVEAGADAMLEELLTKGLKATRRKIDFASTDLYEALKAIINSETITGRDNFNNALEALSKAEVE